MDSTQPAGPLAIADLSRIIEMAWEDRTPFEAITANYGLSEAEVIVLMRRAIKPSAFRNWRARVHRRQSKHLALRSKEISRGYCPTQYKLKASRKRRTQ